VFRAGIRALEAAREHERALAWIDAAMLHAAQHGAHADSAIYRAHRAAIERRTGQWEQAVVLACHAVDELRDSRRAELGDALRILGDLHRVRGDLAGARRAYDEARVHGGQDAEVGGALVLLAEGQAAAAADKLREALAAHPGDDRLFALRVLPFLVEARVRAGRLDGAAAALEHLEREVGRSDYVFGPAVVAHAKGLLHAARGENERAQGAFQAAHDQWKLLGQPYESARVCLDLSGLLISGGEARRGAEIARGALSVFEELGAMDQAELARRMLRRAGVRTRTPKPAVPVGPHGLTTREIGVLGELAKGSTNKQIARALGITDKTVSIHVSNILAKLGCTTRTQAAGLAIAERLVPSG
jgi:ATP/maltotriose-dependent transcriptional regulator MalT